MGGGCGLAGRHARTRRRRALAAIYALMMVPGLLATRHGITTSRCACAIWWKAWRAFTSAIPAKSILLEGVDTDLFWNGVLDRPFRLFGLDHIYLAPGSEKRIEAHPDLGNIGDYILPAAVVDAGAEARGTGGLRRARSAPAQHYGSLCGAAAR